MEEKICQTSGKEQRVCKSDFQSQRESFVYGTSKVWGCGGGGCRRSHSGKRSQESPGRLDLKEKHPPERNLLGNCRSFFRFFSSYLFRFSSSSCILEALYRSQAGRKSSREGKRFLFVSKISCTCVAFNDTN